MQKVVLKLVLKALGFACLGIGMLGMLTPLPFGILFLVLASLLLIPTSPGFTAQLRRWRLNSPRFDRAMASLIRRLPLPYRRILRETDVDSLDRLTRWNRQLHGHWHGR